MVVFFNVTFLHAKSEVSFLEREHSDLMEGGISSSKSLDYLHRSILEATKKDFMINNSKR